MTEINLLDKDVNTVIEIVRELRINGYQLGHDFDWCYYPPHWDNFSGDAVHNRHTVFTFYKDELASWFSLRFN